MSCHWSGRDGHIQFLKRWPNSLACFSYYTRHSRDSHPVADSNCVQRVTHHPKSGTNRQELGKQQCCHHITHSSFISGWFDHFLFLVNCAYFEMEELKALQLHLPEMSDFINNAQWNQQCTDRFLCACCNVLWKVLRWQCKILWRDVAEQWQKDSLRVIPPPPCMHFQWKLT